MLAVRHSLTGAMVALVALLAALATTVELGPLAWAAGLVCGGLLSVTVARGIVAAGISTLGPADLVTLGRAALACAVAAVVAAPSADGARAVVVALAVLALVLDAADGRVARRTRTSSAFGARFDGEADAFLLMVLSVYVAPGVGWWVLSIGAARYVFGAAGWVLPWLQSPLPPRYWRKVVAAVQGVVLTWAAAEVGPPAMVVAGLAVALALLAESFGRDVVWLWVRREGSGRPVRQTVQAEPVATLTGNRL